MEEVADSNDYSWIIEAIKEEPQLPMLTLINTFGGKDAETKEFRETLEEIQGDLHYNLTSCLEKNLETSMDAFFELDNLKPEIELLNESEQYLADGMKHSLENFRTTMSEYNQLVSAKQNLGDVREQVKNCLEMVEEFQKIEKLAADNEFYRAALTMERLRVRISIFEDNYQFVGRLKEAMNKLLITFTDDVIERISRFLLQLSHKLEEIGKDALDNGWACNPYEHMDFTDLAHAKFIAKTFCFEEKLDVGLQKQAELLLNHVYQSGRSNTSRAPDVVKFCSQILGFFVALIATASIAQGATSFMTSLWQTAVLQMQEKIDSIRGANLISSTSQCEQIVMSLAELIKFSQWYCLPSHQLEIQIEKLFNEFCCCYMQEQLKEANAKQTESLSTLDSLQEIVNGVNTIAGPKFENPNLNSEKLLDFWGQNKSKICGKVLKKVLAAVIELQMEQVSRESSMFGRKLCSIWDELTEISENPEALRGLDFIEKELQEQRDALRNILGSSVETNLDTVFKALDAGSSNLDDVLSESSNSPSGVLSDLSDWLTGEMKVYAQHAQLQQEMTKTFLLFNLEFAADVFWNNPTLKLQHLDSLATYALNVLPVIISSFGDESHLISTETEHILELMKLLESGNYAANAAAILNAVSMACPKRFNVSDFAARLNTLKHNSSADKFYIKSKKGKEGMKLLNNLIKAVNKLKK